tara:strand:- start:1768 stop:2328 length:561 start_codon:yes stop_codon:yes gene_type:complete
VKSLFILILFLFISSLSKADTSEVKFNKYFHIGQMKSYHKEFTLYFKTREKAVLVRGENSNYINDYPQDLYIYNHITKEDHPLITYEWFPKKVKKIYKNYNYPVFPEDFAYYLLNDNNTLVLVSAIKNFNQNLKYDIKNKKLVNYKSKGKLNFIISTYAKSCGHKSLKNNYECEVYKPLVSKNLIN